MTKKIIKVFIMSILTFTCMFAVTLNVNAAGENLSTAISVDLGQSFGGTLDGSTRGTSCYYKFVLPQNSIIKIYAKTGGHSQDMTVTLMDSEGNSLPNSGSYLSTEDDNNWGYQSASCKIGLNKGTYYIKTTTYDSSDVSYSVKVSVVTKSTSKVKIAGCKNNYRSNALSFNIGNKLTSIAQNNYYSHFENQQYYKFKVTTARTVNMKFFTDVNKHKSKIYIDISNSSGDVIASCDIVGEDGKNTSTLKKYLKKGTYYICVDTFSDYEPRYTIRTAYKPYSTNITSLASTSKKTMTVKWKKKSPTTGYQIQYSKNSNFKNAKSVKISGSYGSKKITGLSSGKKYYVRVRRYNKSFGITYYSSWSTKKSVKIK